MSNGKWLQTGKVDWKTGDYNIWDELNETIENASPPIGSIIAWNKEFNGAPATLPEGWVECDGSTISDADSPYDGVAVPSLNSTNKFLRGATTSGSTGGATTHNHTLQNSDTVNAGGSPRFSNATLGSVSNNPKNMTVVWIIRIK